MRSCCGLCLLSNSLHNYKLVLVTYYIAGIFRRYTFSRMDLYKGFRGFYFRGLSSSLLVHAHINMQLYLHTVSLESRLSLYKNNRIGEALCPPPLAERLLCRPWSGYKTIWAIPASLSLDSFFLSSYCR